ncbi:immediate early response gene 2 protein [Lepisosteus oculatus]|uniref:immediate early response gene 2 protein n=1 Tax=Lepisosteus oculatus TaxID=7918 RepID=UPI0035F52B23
MEMTCDAKRIVAVSLGKLYSSRSQRGGCRLHRSLLLSLVVRSAREIYHACSAQAAAAVPGQERMDTGSPPAGAPAPPGRPLAPRLENTSAAQGGEPRAPYGSDGPSDKENCSPVGQRRLTRKRPGTTAAEPEFLPSKRARMEAAGEEQPPSRLAALRCHRAGETLSAMPLSRAIVAF